MRDRPILIVHPIDKTTKFLDRIKNHLIGNFDNQVHHFNIHPNKTSHIDCLHRINEHSLDGIIVFLGHGRGDKLYGSKGDLWENREFVSPESISERPDKYFYNDDFINDQNVNIFKGKKVFCLSCNSREKIGKLAVENGAISFFGFGDIPTSVGEFKESGVSVGHKVVMKMKSELTYIIKTSLTYCINRGDSFQGLLNTIRFITNQRIAEVLMRDKGFKERSLLADYLYYLKTDAIVHGDGSIKLINK
ncbi:MAG: hypothetical protein JSS79_15475 [Bacteroidetes bacterium]|nr:hypothetical protein [Bacteroidota bacterium]